MSKFYKLALILFFIIVVASSNSYAQEKKNIKLNIGVVNMDMVLQQSIATKTLKSKIDKKRKEYQEVIKKRGKKLQDFQQEVIKQQDSMKKEELTAKKKLFQQKVISAQRDTQEEIKNIDMAVAESLKELRKKAVMIVADIAKERNLDIVLSHQQVIIANKNIDITKDVLERLNKNVKSIPIKWKK